jgi:hypothetical protein
MNHSITGGFHQFQILTATVRGRREHEAYLLPLASMRLPAAICLLWLVCLVQLVVSVTGTEANKMEVGADACEDGNPDFLPEMSAPPGFRLRHLARTSRGTYYISSDKSAFEKLVFHANSWKKDDNVWNATMVYLVRKKHVKSLWQHLKRTFMDGDGKPPSHLHQLQLPPSIADLPFLLNRIEGASLLTDKVALTRLLHHTSATGNAHRDNTRGVYSCLQPLTLVLSTMADCNAWYQQHGKRHHLWVKKEARQSQGNGILFLSSAGIDEGGEEQLCQKLLLAATERPFVLQRHIDRPLLLEGKKSELRAYWFIASVDPLIAFMYHRGTVRLASENYPSQPLTGDLLQAHPTAHILNVAQQKKHHRRSSSSDSGDAPLSMERLKWDWDRWEADLRQRGLIPRNENGNETSFVDSVLVPSIRRMLQIVLKKSKRQLKAAMGAGKRRWELFGMDMLIEEKAKENDGGGGDCIYLTDDLRLFLTEIQVGPGLSVQDNPVKQQLLSPMLQSMLDIVLEVDERRLKNTGFKDLHVEESWLPLYG